MATRSDTSSRPRNDIDSYLGPYITWTLWTSRTAPVARMSKAGRVSNRPCCRHLNNHQCYGPICEFPKNGDAENGPKIIGALIHGPQNGTFNL